MKSLNTIKYITESTMALNKWESYIDEAKTWDEAKNIYYLSVIFDDGNPYPGGQSQCKAEIQVRMRNPNGKWDPSNDPSYAGLQTGTASTCEKAAIYEDGKLVYLDGSEEVIPATGHTEVEIPAIEPTVDSVGYTAGTKCAVCGEILVAPEEIPALKDGFVKDDDEEWRLYEGGKVKEDFTGIYGYNGGEFYLDKGVLQDEASGPGPERRRLC